jgi:fluoride exporter
VNRTDLPVGTLLINITGSFLLGLAFALFTERTQANPTVRIAVTVGFLGAYTTFSTFAFETLEMVQRGALLTSIGYVLASVVPSIVAVWLGARLAT